MALLAVRPAFAPGAGVGVLIAVAGAMAGWAALVALAYRRARWLRVWPPRPGRRTVEGYAVIVAGLAVVGSVLVML